MAMLRLLAGGAQVGGPGRVEPGARVPAVPRDESQPPRTSEPSSQTVSQQAEALRNPGPVTTSTPVNPLQSGAHDLTKESYGAARDLASGITAGTNEEINRELGRARDEISVGMQKEGVAAMSRGADPSLFRSRALASGARDMGNLQARLADVALNKRQTAVNSQVGAASNVATSAAQTAAEQRAMHLGTQAASLADARELRERAESQARLEQAPFDRLVEMMRTMGQFGGAFSGLTAGNTGSPLSTTAPRGPGAAAVGGGPRTFGRTA